MVIEVGESDEISPEMIEEWESLCAEQVDCTLVVAKGAEGEDDIPVCTENDDDDSYGAVERRCKLDFDSAVLADKGLNDGQIAAESSSQDIQELLTIVGVLGGVIAALVIIIAGGAYYMWYKLKRTSRTVSFDGGEVDDIEQEDVNINGVEEK